MWMPHLPGQHYDVRLTAPDGYQAQRSYSIASSPLDEGQIELTIDRLDDGEVSPYFHEVVTEGDQVEVRGPFASYFVWRGEAPVLLVGGGSGVVPLMAMLRHRRRAMPDLEMRLVYSVRSPEEVIYAGRARGRRGADLHAGASGGVDGPHRAHRLRADRRSGAGEPGIAFVCGSNGFVETASQLLLEAGFSRRADPHRALRPDGLTTRSSPGAAFSAHRRDRSSPARAMPGNRGGSRATRHR